MTEPFAKDAERRARNRQTDTSVEKVWRYECGKNKTMVLKYEGHWVKHSDYAALAAERDALKRKLDKAVEALEKVQAFVQDLEPCADQGHTLVPALYYACTTLAELKGQDYE